MTVTHPLPSRPPTRPVPPGPVPLGEPAASDRRNFGRIPPMLPLPDLIATGRESFRAFMDTGLRELFGG